MFFLHTSETDGGILLFTAGLQVRDTPSSPDFLHDPPAQKCQHGSWEKNEDDCWPKLDYFLYFYLDRQIYQSFEKLIFQ